MVNTDSNTESKNKNKPVVLIVRDGWGENPNADHDKFNAVKLANTPVCDALVAQYPMTHIATCCRDVGLPDGTMGNSEVGHQNLGAGRIVFQESVRITVAVEDGSIQENQAMVDAISHAKASGGKVHLLGIASDAGVHGLMEHLYGVLETCKKHGVSGDDACVHLFTDGRDTGPFQGKGYVEEIVNKTAELGVGQVASIIGRYYAMDRDNRWERVKQAYDLLTDGSDAEAYSSAVDAVQNFYENPTNDSQQGDEFITPRVVVKEGGDAKASRIKDGDSVIFYNYRGDRPREITRAFMQPDFFGNVPPSPDSGAKGFDRGDQLSIKYVCMTAYDASFYDFPNLSVAYPKPGKMDNIGAQLISEAGMTQFHCAETEKFPHVTFFFNDYREEPFPGESRQMAQSPQVATYDLQPEMSAYELRDIIVNRINSDECDDFILINFANGDMVGHTGKLDAAIKACETVDECVGNIVEAALAKGGKLIVTADHGNAEQMFDPSTNNAHTAHTLYKVECILVGEGFDKSTQLRSGGRLADVMPTTLTLLGLDVPAEMDGQSLLV